MTRSLTWLVLIGISGCGSPMVEAPDAESPSADAGSDAGPPSRLDAGAVDAGATDAGAADAGARLEDAAIEADAHVEADAGALDAGPLLDVVPHGETMAMGTSVTCAVDAGRVLCWGLTQYGQLGDGAPFHTCASGCTDYSPVGVAAAGIDDARFVAASFGTTCALRESGAIDCWGVNSQGQLGDGVRDHAMCAADVDCARVPVRVDGASDYVSLAGGAQFFCALRRHGTVECWGANQRGQLGDGVSVHEACGDVDCSRTPVEVSGLADAVQIVAGASFACARRAGGEVACWGSNQTGQIGDGMLMHELCVDTVLSDCARVPATVAEITDAVDLTAGASHACAIRSDGTTWCWGSDQLLQLGDGATTHARCGDVECSRVPVPSSGSELVELAAGGNTTCAIAADRTVRCVGSGADALLGDGLLTGHGTCGTRDCAPSWVTATGLSDVVELSGSTRRMCARRMDGARFCWGINVGGALGDGVATHARCSIFDCSPTPVRVTAM